MKAVIAKRFKVSTFPDLTYVRNIHTHDLQKLVKAAELEQQQKQAFQADPALEVNWLVVKDLGRDV